MRYTFSLHTISDAAGWLWNNRGNAKVFAFNGGMGAGKTTFIHALCNFLKVKDTVSSPTFSIINEYRFVWDDAAQLIYHMDLYRLSDEDEAVRAGVEDCLFSGHYCLVEWPDVAPDIFPDDTLYINIQLEENDQRTIILQEK